MLLTSVAALVRLAAAWINLSPEAYENNPTLVRAMLFAYKKEKALAQSRKNAKNAENNKTNISKAFLCGLCAFAALRECF
ncbi:MAG TPA: hypothetical protein VNX47_10980 [Nevskia sp.]|nr:hypothetical protein [Nevskia sp.]